MIGQVCNHQRATSSIGIGDSTHLSRVQGAEWDSCHGLSLPLPTTTNGHAEVTIHTRDNRCLLIWRGCVSELPYQTSI